MYNCALNHIFGDPNDFIGGIMPMEPVKVTGLGEAQATGYGNVSIKFRCNEGKRHEHILHDVWYLPGAAIRMISIPQLDANLDQQTDGATRASIFSCGPFSIFKWGEIMVTILHCPPSRTPLMPEMVMHNNDEVSYDAFHSAFTCMQGGLPERNALCLLAGQEHYETSATAEKMVTTCEGDKLA